MCPVGHADGHLPWVRVRLGGVDSCGVRQCPAHAPGPEPFAGAFGHIRCMGPAAGVVAGAPPLAVQPPPLAPSPPPAHPWRLLKRLLEAENKRAPMPAHLTPQPHRHPLPPHPPHSDRVVALGRRGAGPRSLLLLSAAGAGAAVVVVGYYSACCGAGDAGRGRQGPCVRGSLDV